MPGFAVRLIEDATHAIIMGYFFTYVDGPQFDMFPSDSTMFECFRNVDSRGEIMYVDARDATYTIFHGINHEITAFHSPLTVLFKLTTEVE